MYLHNLFKLSLQDVFTKFSRLFFLSLGVAVGTCAIAFLSSLHTGLKKVVLDEILQKLPFNQLKIRPISQKPKNLLEFTFKQKDESLNLTGEKIEIIQNLKGVSAIWPERTLNFPIVFRLKEVQLATFTLPDITMPTTIFGIHPDLVKNHPELHKKFQYSSDPDSEIPVLCSAKIFEMMNDTSIAQGKVGDLLSSIVNEQTFLDKPIELKIGFSTRDEQRIQEGFERAKKREERLKGEIAGISKFLTSQFANAFSAGYESDRPWITRKARIIGFTDEVPLVGLSVPLPFVEEWLKIRAAYELDFYSGGLWYPKEALESWKQKPQNLHELKQDLQWIDPPAGFPEQRILFENDRIRFVGNPFLPQDLHHTFSSSQKPLELRTPRWFPLAKEVHGVFWEYTLDFPAALYLPSHDHYLPIELHGIDSAFLEEKQDLLAYQMSGNDPVPALVSPRFFQRLKEAGVAQSTPDLYPLFQSESTLLQNSFYIVLGYEPEQKEAMKQERERFLNESAGRPQFIFRALHIVGVSERVPDIGFTVPKGFIERAYRWKYPQLKTEEYTFSGVSVLLKETIPPSDSSARRAFEQKLLQPFLNSPTVSSPENLQWKGNILSLRHSHWQARSFEEFFKIKKPLLSLRGGTFTDPEFKARTQRFYPERTSPFPVRLLIPEQKESALEVSLVGVAPELFQDPQIQEEFKPRESRDYLPVVLSPLLFENLKAFGTAIPEPWASFCNDPSLGVGKEFWLAIGEVQDSLKPLPALTFPPAPLAQEDPQKIKREPFLWKAKIVAFSSEASPLGLTVPFQELSDLIRWYYPLQIYEKYSGVTTITKSPEETAFVAKQIREHPALKLDIVTGTETAETLSTLTTYLKYAMVLIGFILFLVAAVSIFNGITLSVLEQSKKIGIYRAVGAKRMDIIFIFMVEASAVGLLGGTLGLLGGIVSIHYFDYFMGQTAPEFAHPNIKLWDTSTGRQLQSFSGHPGPIYSLACAVNAQILASGSHDHRIKLWDMSTRSEITTFQGHQDSIYALAFSAKEEWLASASADKTVKIWDIAQRTEKQTLKGRTASVHTLAFSPDSQWLALGTAQGILEIWDLTQFTLKHKLSAHEGALLTLAFSGDGKTLFTGGADGALKTWNLSEETPKSTLLYQQEGDLRTLALSPQGDWIASAGKTGVLTLKNLKKPQEKEKYIRGHSAPVESLQFLPHKKALLLASASQDQQAKLWDIAGLQMQQSFEGHSHALYALSFAGEKRLVTAGADHTTLFIVQPQVFFFILCIGLFISILASTLPSIRAAHITPADVLRDI